MACLRESAVDGRFGTLSCDEEGCIYTRFQVRGDSFAYDNSSEADCVLQLRLRAGDSEDTLRERYEGFVGRVISDDAWERFYQAYRGLERTESKELADEALEIQGRARGPIFKSTTESDPRRFGKGLKIDHLSLDKEPNAFGYGLVVAHDNGKTEHNRIREQWEQSMGVPSESGRDEGEHAELDPDGIDPGIKDRSFSTEGLFDDLDIDFNKFAIRPEVARDFNEWRRQRALTESGSALDRRTESRGDLPATDRSEFRWTEEWLRRVIRESLIEHGLIPGDDKFMRPPVIAEPAPDYRKD